MNKIVVGTDGSEGAELALRWAAAEAGLRHATLEVVAVFELPLSVETLYADVEKALRTEAEAAAQRARELVEHQCGPGTVEIHTAVVAGPAAPALINAAAAAADLLVVGAHGHGVFAGLLLGSVSLHCVTHSRCPVVVVRRRANQ